MMQHMETNLSLRYSGPAVDDGCMDVYAVSANMIAFSEFVVVATKSTFGNDASAKAEVTGFGKGSFITNLLFSFSGEAASIFTVMPMDQLYSVIKDAFALWKHLKGQPPQAISYAEQSAKVTNNNGQVLLVQTHSLTLVMNEKGANAADRFVRQALSQPGVDSISLDTGLERIADASKNEADYFVQVTAAETLTDNIATMGLVIESPSFKDGNKWKVFDGSQSIFIDMLDQDFLDRIDSGERFGKGDTLLADVRLVQKRTGTKLEAERSVIKVLEHKQSGYQGSLLKGGE